MVPRRRSHPAPALAILLLLVACAPRDPSASDRRTRVSLVVTGGTVVTMDGHGTIVSPGAVAVDGRVIVAVDRPDVVASRFAADETIDATGEVVVPGLVNTHTHAPMVMYRGLADDRALDEWLTRYIFPAEAKTVSPEMVRVGTRLAVLEMIQSGTSTFADMYYFEEEIARVTRAAGLRGVLGETIIGLPSPDAKTPDEALSRAEAFLREFAGDDLIVAAVAPHAMYTLDRAHLLKSTALAARYQAPVLIHVSETRDELQTSRDRHGMTPVAYLESIGFFGPRVVAAHCVWVTDDEIPILLRRGVAVSHNPESNMKLASGAAPVPKMLSSGLTVALGTDGAASNNDLDMFEAMRQAALLHKLTSGDPTSVSATVALRMATADGARALGLEDRIGSLEPGKRADLITVSMKGARQVPLYNPVSHLVYVSRGSDVQTTVVNGRVLMRGRKVVSLDEAAVLDAARRLADRVSAAIR